MKTLVTLIITVVLAFNSATLQAPTFTAEETPTDETFHYWAFNRDYEVNNYEEIEKNFIEQAINDGYTSLYIVDASESSALIENRADLAGYVVERCIGMVTNNPIDGGGVLLNAPDPDYYYISYRGIDGTHNGTIMLTYCIYERGNNYTDDVIKRYDYILDTTYED